MQNDKITPICSRFCDVNTKPSSIRAALIQVSAYPSFVSGINNIETMTSQADRQA
jgi:hypothetical protein